jgi:hypothetical protein
MRHKWTARDIFGAIVAWIVFFATLAIIGWVLICLFVTFNPAKAAEIEAQDIYMRWHRCMDWCE